MTIRISTGLRASLLSDYGLTAMMNYGVIEVYSGSQPDTASLQPTGTLLARITNNGDAFEPNTLNGGLQLELADTGGLTFAGVWRMTGVDTGIAGWWRWKWNAPDDDSDSFYFPRMDGLVNESLFLENTSITPTTDVVIDNFNVNFME